MADVLTVARSELILGGQKSGKSRRGEQLAQSWLAQSPQHKAVFIATAQAWDDEMTARIARHQHDRAERLPGMLTLEEPLALAPTLLAHCQPDTLVLVDCMTLWLTNFLAPMPVLEPNKALAPDWRAQLAIISGVLVRPAGPVVLVGNEIGLGVIPMGRETREFVDALGLLNQQLAAACERVTLMVAGLPLQLKAAA